MDESQQHQALLTAMTTEHFVLQTAANALVSESQSRASLYVFTLSSSLIAMGFTSGKGVFLPFVATVLPAVFLLGLLTVLRLVDSALEVNGFLTGIARVHAYYRTLAPGAGEYFAPRFGRWPEAEVTTTPVFKLGKIVALLTTNASMVAFINSLVAGAGVTLLAGGVFGQERLSLAVLLGILTVVVMMIAFYTYQGWRYSSLDKEQNQPPRPTDQEGQHGRT
ncbi:MAG: hypothetical protein ABI679_13145 [Gemmatimonadota bacterium]